MTVPIVDVDHQPGMWTQALAGHTRTARQLVRAFRREAEATYGPIVPRIAAGAASWIHRRLGSHYGDEIDELAGLLEVPAGEIVLANCFYDLAAGGPGCSTFVASTPSGPMLARNMDWGFPRQLLRKTTMAFKFHGASHGDYSTVGFPGLVGPLAAVSRGRFAIAINYVRHIEESNLGAIARRVVGGYWPVAFAVRQVLDEAPDFTAAVRYLTKVPLLAPVLFTLAGTNLGEGVVIERTAEDGVVRPMEDDAPVCVTNHYISEDLIDSNEGIEEIDTVERLDALERGLADTVAHDARAALKLLSRKSLMSRVTAHQVVARPHDGMCVVRVPGQRAVTVDLG